MSLELLSTDRLYVGSSPLITHASTITNMWVLEQGWQPAIRNTKITRLPVGRPEVPAIDDDPVTLSLHIIGEVSLALPTPATYSNPKVGVRVNWRALKTIFETQLTVETVTMKWSRLTTASAWEHFTCSAQLSSWQINNAGITDLQCSVEMQRFTPWVSA